MTIYHPNSLRIGALSLIPTRSINICSLAIHNILDLHMELPLLFHHSLNPSTGLLPLSLQPIHLMEILRRIHPISSDVSSNISNVQQHQRSQQLLLTNSFVDFVAGVNPRAHRHLVVILATTSVSFLHIPNPWRSTKALKHFISYKCTCIFSITVLNTGIHYIGGRR